MIPKAFVLDPMPAAIPALSPAFMAEVEAFREAMSPSRIAGRSYIAMWNLAAEAALARWDRMADWDRAFVMDAVEVAEGYEFSRRFPARSRFVRAISACALGNLIGD